MSTNLIKPKKSLVLATALSAMSLATISCGSVANAELIENNSKLTKPTTSQVGNVTTLKVSNPESAVNSIIYKNGVDLNKSRVAGLPTPSVQISQVDYITTILVPTTRNNQSQTLDVSLIDDFINKISPHARHYHPSKKFSNATELYNVKLDLKNYEESIRPYAEASNASFDVLIRAAKLNGMARNLDLGSDYAIRAGNYIARALKIQPNHPEANFIYGMMLSEGGGFKEGKKYLDKAASLNYIEAEQSLAQADLLNDKRGAALSRLQRLRSENPNNQTIARQIEIIQDGKYYIWDLYN